MCEDVKVSIITVCLNSEKTIEQTIQSVINQTYPNIEYIIIDGKSTDRTLEIIDRYKDKISILVSEKDAGIYYAMNKGLKLATGELIGIINSDDWYEPDAVETIVNTFLEDRTAQIFYGNINFYDKDKFIGIRYSSSLKELHTWMAIPHPTVFIKSEVYKKYGFNIKYKIGADHDLMLKLYTKNYTFRYVNKIISSYRIGGYNELNLNRRMIENITICLHYPADFITVLRIFLNPLINLGLIVCGYMRKIIRLFVD
jgi:glycosyltransferase involved in cell wall biosynthesis